MGNIKGAKRGSYKKTKSLNEIKQNLDMVEQDFEPEVETKLPAPEKEEVKHVDAVIEAQTTIEQATVTEPAAVNEPIADSQDKAKYESWMSEFTDVTPVKNKVKVESEVEQDAEVTIKPKKKKTAEPEPVQNENAMLVNGTMLIAFCDFFFPSLVKFFFTKFMKDPRAKKVKHTDVVLTNDQVESLEPVADAAAKVIFEKVNPMVLFAFAMTISYGMNFKFALEEVKE